MQIFNGINSFSSSQKSIFALGMFDGVHLGHKKIIETAKKLGHKTFVLTFDTHPKALFSPKKIPYLLNTNQEKVEILQNLGVDGVIFCILTSTWPICRQKILFAKKLQN